MDIGNQVRTRREAAGFSQEELAKRVYVSRQTISNWECDRTYPDVQSLLLLSELFGTSLDTLVKGDVDVMDEIIAQDRELRRKITLLTYVVAAVLAVIACIVLFTPTLDALGDSFGVIPTALLVLAVTGCLMAVLVVLALKERRILKKHDIVTYRQLRAFQCGEDFKGSVATEHGVLDYLVLTNSKQVAIVLAIAGVVGFVLGITSVMLGIC